MPVLSMTRRRAAAAAWTVGAVAYLGAEAFAAAARPGYHYAHDYISDLGVPGRPLAGLMNTAFAVQGLMFLLGAMLAFGRRPQLGCAVANAVGNVLVATVHAGHGPMHLIGAALAIVGGNATALTGAGLAPGRGVRIASRLLGTVGLLALAGLVVRAGTDTAPVFERAAVYPILAWQLLAAAALLPARGQHA